MSRFLGPRLKLVRRLGTLPGLTNKVPLKEYEPGQHGPPPLVGEKKKKKKSQYGKRLEEKQKLRLNYGITERQLLNYVRRARKGKGSAGEFLIQLLEMRLDCIVFRSHFASTIAEARQLVTHGHVLVNKTTVDIPSYSCQIEDLISIHNVTRNQESAPLPSHLTMMSSDSKSTSEVTSGAIFVNSWVNRKEVSLKIKELLIIEYYSRQA